MEDSRKNSTDQDLDQALKGTFPASDPVSPGSHVEEEMERRRKVLEQDAAEKAGHTTDVRTDSPGRVTLPAEPVDADEAREEDAAQRTEAKTARKQRAAKRQHKTPRRSPRPTGRRTGGKKTHSKKRKSLRGAPDTRRKKGPRSASKKKAAARKRAPKTARSR